MKLTTRDVRLVTAIDRHGHFGRAAEALGVSQPALSRALKALEHRLGDKLFLRGRGGVEATELGRLIADRGRLLLADMSDLEQAVEQARGEGVGSLAMVVGHYPAELTVAPAVGALLAARPGLQFTLRSQEWSTIKPTLAAREADLALFETSPVESDERFECRLVGQHPVFAFARAGHPLTRLKQASIADLLQFPWAMPLIPWRAARHFGLGREAVPAGAVDRVRQVFVPRVLAPFPRLAREVTRASDCISMAMLTQIEGDIARGRLELIDHHGDWMYLRYGFAWLKRRPPGAAAIEFMGYIESEEARLHARESALRSRYWGERPLGAG